MPEEVKRYRSRDGQEFDKIQHAGYRDQLLDLRELCSNAKQKLAKFVDKCTHPEFKETGTRLDFRPSGVYDEYDKELSDQVERVVYKCKCCGAIGLRWVDSEQIVFYRPMNPMWDN